MNSSFIVDVEPTEVTHPSYSNLYAVCKAAEYIYMCVYLTRLHNILKIMSRAFLYSQDLKSGIYHWRYMWHQSRRLRLGRRLNGRDPRPGWTWKWNSNYVTLDKRPLSTHYRLKGFLNNHSNNAICSLQHLFTW